MTTLKNSRFFDIFTLKISQYLQYLLTIRFFEELNNISQIHLNILPKLWLVFGFHQQKKKEKSVFSDIFMTTTLKVNMINRQITPFFPLESLNEWNLLWIKNLFRSAFYKYFEESFAGECQTYQLLHHVIICIILLHHVIICTKPCLERT